MTAARSGSAWDEVTRRLLGLADGRGVHVVVDAPLGAATTYRVGGTAAVRVEVGSIDALCAVALEIAGTAAIDGLATEVVILGRGSNLLVADGRHEVVCLVATGSFDEIVIDGEQVRLGAGVLLPVAARRTAAAGLGGFEWAVGVPGTIGGAAVMNAGGHGSDMAASLVEVHLVDLSDGQTRSVAAASLELGYRHSTIGPAEMITGVTLSLIERTVAEAEAEISEIVAWRRQHQPGGANAGSVFTNPPGDSAGRLIERAGLSGFTIGGASVSTRHSNFIQTEPGASAADVLAVMGHVADTVERRTGVKLVTETRTVGFSDHQRAGVRARSAVGTIGGGA